MPFRFTVFGLLLALLLAWTPAAQAHGCGARVRSAPQAASPASAAGTAGGPGAHGLDLANLDRSVSPCQDFYEFADGGWIHSHAIPPGHDSWGLIDELRERNQEILRQILQREADGRARARPGSIDRELGDFYAGCMDTRAIDAAGWRPLAGELGRIERLRHLGDLAPEVAHLQGMGAAALFALGVAPDSTGSARMIAHARPAGLGLLDREDYLQAGAGFGALREKYLIHVRRMFRLLGDRRARAEAQTVLRIETRLARAAASPGATGDPEAADHKMTERQLQALAPHFSWGRYFRALGLGVGDTIDVTSPYFFEAMDRELASVPLADWKIYLRWQLIHAAAPDLSRPFARENFDFYGRTLTGASRIEPRWQRCVAAAARELREPLGRKYAREALPPTVKAAALAMAGGLVAAFRQDLQSLYWMDPATRAAAIAKLDRMTIEVGYPDRWPADPVYRVTNGPFVENMLGANYFRFRLELAGIGKPADRSRWPISVFGADPIYDPAINAIFLPAGLLQPPLFDPRADDALNYGGIGAIVGHEMTHGFDGQGSRFGADGNRKDWWTPEDGENFQQLAECVADQYSTYAAVDDLHENGHRVLAESLADIGGLAIAYKAFEKTPGVRSRRKIQGFTATQRFFLAYARVWTEKEDPQYIRRMVMVNPHAIARYRVIGPLSDFEPFARAFDCRDRDAMFRPMPDRCAIW